MISNEHTSALLTALIGNMEILPQENGDIRSENSISLHAPDLRLHVYFLFEAESGSIQSGGQFFRQSQPSNLTLAELLVEELKVAKLTTAPSFHQQSISSSLNGQQ